MTWHLNKPRYVVKSCYEFDLLGGPFSRLEYLSAMLVYSLSGNLLYNCFNNCINIYMGDAAFAMKLILQNMLNQIDLGCHLYNKSFEWLLSNLYNWVNTIIFNYFQFHPYEFFFFSILFFKKMNLFNSVSIKYFF